MVTSGPFIVIAELVESVCNLERDYCYHLEYAPRG